MNQACSISEIDASSLLPIQKSIVSNQFVEIPCLTTLPRDDETPLEFRIEKTDGLIDLTASYLRVTVQILKADGSKMGKGDEGAPINLFAYTMFSNVLLSISDQPVSLMNNQYGYMCYMLALLQIPEAAKSSLLMGALWIKDSSMAMDATTDLNSAVGKRLAMSQDSRDIELFTKVVTSDAMVFPRFLPNQTEINLKFYPDKASRVLMADPTKIKPIMKITSAQLYVSRYKLSDQALVKQNQILARGALYPMIRHDVRVKTLMKGEQNLEWIPFTGKLPRRIYFWQTALTAYNGDFNKNPFNLLDYNINHFSVVVNDHVYPVNTGLTFNHSVQKANIMRAYELNLRELNKYDIDITLDDFLGGFFYLVADITPDHSASCDYVSPTTEGTLRIKADYEKALPDSIAVFCMGEFDATLKIDKDRNPSWM